MNNIPAINQSQVIKLYQEGKTLKDITILCKLKTDWHIRKILNNNHIQFRRKGELRIQTGLPLNMDYFEKISSPDRAYWLGFLTADGHIYPNGYKTTLASKDKEVIVKFKKSINSGHKIGKYDIFDKRTKKTYTRYCLQICSKRFASHLIALGLKGRKSFQCNLPKISAVLFSHYLRGLFDGDGSICFLKSGERRISLIATRKILEDIQEYLVMKFNFTKTKLAIVASKKGYDICKLYINNKPDQDNFIKFLYDGSQDPIRLSRKYKKSLQLFEISRKPHRR